MRLAEVSFATCFCVILAGLILDLGEIAYSYGFLWFFFLLGCGYYPFLALEDWLVIRRRLGRWRGVVVAIVSTLLFYQPLFIFIGMAGYVVALYVDAGSASQAVFYLHSKVGGWLAMLSLVVVQLFKYFSYPES